MQKLIYGKPRTRNQASAELENRATSSQSLLQSKLDQLRSQFRQTRKEARYRKGRTPKNEDTDIQQLIKLSSQKYQIFNKAREDFSSNANASPENQMKTPVLQKRLTE